MGLIDNGNQSKVFDYKQEGTSEGFNKIMYNLIPKGIIKGGNLVKSTDASVTVSPFLIFFEDPDKKVGVRIETSANATSDISISKPYIIGRFTWLNLEDNYMDIISASFSEIEPSDLIFGRGIFNSGVLQDFDYSRKSWSKNFYDNSIDFEPSFLVVPNEPYDNKLKVGKGSAYINGKKVVFDSEKQTPTFDLNVTNGRKDLVVVNDDASITIIKGTDTVDPVAPLFPNKGLVVAVVTLPPNSTSINGGFVEYIYNNNYYQAESVMDKATFFPQGDTLIKRDSEGRAQIATPSADSDIATKKYVDDTASGDAEAVQTNLTAHINNKSNPHGVTLVQLGVTATATELNKLDGFTGSVNSLNCTNKLNSDAQGQLNGKAPNFHASTSTTYGLGATATYGHVKVVDTPNLTTYPEGTTGVGVTPFGVVNLLHNLQQYWFKISEVGFDDYTIYSVTYGNGKFVAGGTNGKGAYSTDGVIWTPIFSSNMGFSGLAIRAITYGNGKFVAVGFNGRGAYSTDGINWTTISDMKFGSYTIRAITYGNGKFVAVGEGFSGRGAYSTDGINWTTISDMKFGSYTIRAITYGNGKFVAIGFNGRGAYSTDGINWTAISDMKFDDYTIYSVTYGNGKFVAGGADGKGAYSTDGINWTAITISNTGFTTYSVTYGNGKFVAVDSNGRGAYSTDGINWTAISDMKFDGFTIFSVTYGNGKFVAGGTNGKGAYCYSV